MREIARQVGLSVSSVSRMIARAEEGRWRYKTLTPASPNTSAILYDAAMAQGRAEQDTGSVCAVLGEIARLKR